MAAGGLMFPQENLGARGPEFRTWEGAEFRRTGVREERTVAGPKRQGVFC
jgi:hypothetical protein